MVDLDVEHRSLLWRNLGLTAASFYLKSQINNMRVILSYRMAIAVKRLSNSEESQEVSESEVWSAVQERALVQALKTFPKEASQRWERVAAAVPGKTVNQCKKKLP
ncbi:hypothetical protein KIW84_014007 [Lathyrus oleraceus]|uniref:Myb-like domain-containing protein n=1 Tax=Pisum sativum TaxID=3888 RepID=A0A9D5GYY5_PEA|nr:hypothetical protein KIW84_014005 [Pisum sativum]KAI5445998.1 hypothetical protein KIW84_014006 [Pisum sativum]KAI5445999.1 hypothetical protein KIW84_014007 [Pisum sativum]